MIDYWQGYWHGVAVAVAGGVLGNVILGCFIVWRDRRRWRKDQ